MALAESASRFELAPRRENFSHIPEVLPLPNLIQTQTDSFEWFVSTGLRELLDEITPITDFTGKNLELHFREFYFEEPKSLGGGVPHPRPDLREAAEGRGRPRHQGDRRGQAPDRLHGRLPVDDRSGHLHHQRRRARRGQPARALAGRVLHRVGGSRDRPHAARCQGDPEPRRLARVRDVATRTCSASRSTASARSRSPRCCAPSASRPMRSSASSAPPTTTPSTPTSSSRSTRIRPGPRTRRSSRSTRSCAPATRRRSRTRAPSSPASSSTSAATTSVASAATS